ncbi:LysR family transcriptional regulator, partial [Pantoea ananatis]
LDLYSVTPSLHRTLGTVMREDRIVSRGINEVLKNLNSSFAKKEIR